MNPLRKRRKDRRILCEALAVNELHQVPASIQYFNMCLHARAAGRPPCAYGDTCYRKNPQHFVEFDHPGTHPLLAMDAAVAVPPSLAVQSAGGANSKRDRDEVDKGDGPAAKQPKPPQDAQAKAAAAQTKAEVKAAAAAEKAAEKAAKERARAKAKAAKAADKEARILTKAVGDAIKEGLRVPAARAACGGPDGRGTLTFARVAKGTYDAFGERALGMASSQPFELDHEELVDVFGVTKVQKGGSRDERYDCVAASFEWETSPKPGLPMDQAWSHGMHAEDEGVLTVEYEPKHMGSNIWWRN